MQRPGGLRREGGRNGPGLPRSFAEDPFFHQPEEFLRDFAPHHRRFGSSPRLLEDDDAFFPSPFDDPNFRSLPRRGAPLRQSERVSPQPQAGVERPIYVQRQQTTPTQSPFGQRSPVPPKGILKKEEPQRDAQNMTTVPVVPVITVTEPIVEINNANPSSYTNGQLNPDKRERRDSSSYNEEPEAGRKSPAPSENTERNISAPEREFTKDSKEMPSAEVNGVAGSEMGQYSRKLSSDGCSEQLIHLLDEAERRVEQLRETANRMEQEKEELLDLINNIKLNTEILRLGEGERDDLNAAVDRILKRCRTVDVVVNTPRNDEQTRALEDVNGLIQGVVTKMHSDLASCKDTVRRMLNACSPDEPDGPIDQRFQAKVVECTADDQKKIRRKLAQLITQIDRAERACMPIT